MFRSITYFTVSEIVLSMFSVLEDVFSIYIRIYVPHILFVPILRTSDAQSLLTIACHEAFHIYLPFLFLKYLSHRLLMRHCGLLVKDCSSLRLNHLKIVFAC